MTTFEDFWNDTLHRQVYAFTSAPEDRQRFGQRLFNEAPDWFQHALYGLPIDPFYDTDLESYAKYEDLKALWDESKP